MPVRVEFGIAQYRRYTIFKALRNEVFKTFGLVMNFIPRILQHVMQEQFEQTMMPDQFPRSPFARRREPDTSVFFIKNKCRTL